MYSKVDDLLEVGNIVIELPILHPECLKFVLGLLGTHDVNIHVLEWSKMVTQRYLLLMLAPPMIWFWSQPTWVPIHLVTCGPLMYDRSDIVQVNGMVIVSVAQLSPW
jgi:hypothetical protein